MAILAFAKKILIPIRKIVLSETTFWRLHVLLTFGLWVVLIYTAFNIKISYDESLSFYALTNDWRKLIGLANTHWLNSLWMKITMLASGDKLFAMRILSLAAFPLYATGVFKIAQTFKNHWFALVLYALLLLNPYSLQFFALARGYGLAMAIQAWLIYELIRVTSYGLRVASWYRIGHLCLLLMLANFSYLYTVFGVFAIFLLHIILRKKGYEWNKNTFKITLFFTLIIVGTAANLMIYRHTGDLWFGGQHFVESVFTSVWLRYIYYLSAETLPQILSYLTLGIIALTTTYFAYDFFQKKEINAGVGLSIIILTMLVLTLFFYFAFETPYLFKRTALQWWIPVFVLFFIWLKKITLSSPFAPPESSTGQASKGGQKNASSFSRSEKSPPLEGGGGRKSIAFISITASNYHTRIEKQRYDELIYSDLVELNPKKVGMGSHFTVQLQHYYQFKNEQFTALNYAPINEKKLADCQNEIAWNDLTQFDYLITSESETIDCLYEKNISFELVKTYGKYRLIRLQ